MADQMTTTRFALRSDAFADGGEIPDVYTHAAGSSVSFPLSWSGAPEGTRSFALVTLDTNPVAHGFVHWMVVGIPASVSSLPEGASGHAMPAGAAEAPNSAGRMGYTGPYPPPGSGVHDYVTTLYALSTENLPVPTRADAGHIARYAAGHVLAQATLTGTYER